MESTCLVPMALTAAAVVMGSHALLCHMGQKGAGMQFVPSQGSIKSSG